MSRAVPEWIGRTDDTPIPDSAKLRICDRQGGKCCKCGAAFGAKCKPEFDHIIPLAHFHKVVTGTTGNRETNIQALCEDCHGVKTKRDKSATAKVTRIRKKHLGISKPHRKIPQRADPWNKEWRAKQERRT